MCIAERGSGAVDPTVTSAVRSRPRWSSTQVSVRSTAPGARLDLDLTVVAGAEPPAARRPPPAARPFGRRSRRRGRRSRAAKSVYADGAAAAAARAAAQRDGSNAGRSMIRI